MILSGFAGWSRWRRTLLLGLALVVGGGGSLAVVFWIAARQAQPDFKPVSSVLKEQQVSFIERTPNYRRPEESTYLTFPEWYLVFNPQDYAGSLRVRPPSEFPYFTSIGQFWQSYVNVAGISNRHYPFNFGNHLMISVIGTSSTVEWLIKGIYENTVGRASEWISGGAKTKEDAYAAEIARGYGEFIPTRPWFEYPFDQAFTGLWSTTGLTGPHLLRKLERKFFLSMEYGVKYIYAGAMRLASHAVFGVADTEVYLSARAVPESALAINGVKRVQKLGDGVWVMTLPHYQGFTDTVPLLARQGVQFEEVAGNDEILVTVVAPAAWRFDLSYCRPIIVMESVSGAPTKRVAMQVPVASLGQAIQEIESRGLRLEHIFDY